MSIALEEAQIRGRDENQLFAGTKQISGIANMMGIVERNWLGEV